jgi:hypothetical protein
MNFKIELERFGFAVCRRVLAAEQLRYLCQLISLDPVHAGKRTRGGGTYAARNLLWDRPETARIMKTVGLDQLAIEALGAPAFPINATYFDKTAEANWAVPGHQDLMMPVESEIAESGFSGWRTKLGVTYVEPPTEVLEKLVALRVHLDDCPASNGALAVVPGSHRRGKLLNPEVSEITMEQYTTCAAEAGDVLVMKPLIVHRSSPATQPAHRRVLHIVYAAAQPGVEVRWKRAPSGGQCPPGPARPIRIDN